MQNLEKILRKLDKKPDGEGLLRELLKELEVDFDESGLMFYRDFLRANKLAIVDTGRAGIHLTITTEGRNWIEEIQNHNHKTRDKFRDEINFERTKFEVDQLRSEVSAFVRQIQGFSELEKLYIAKAQNLRMMMWIALGISIVALLISFISIVG